MMSERNWLGILPGDYIQIGGINVLVQSMQEASDGATYFIGDKCDDRGVLTGELAVYSSVITPGAQEAVTIVKPSKPSSISPQTVGAALDELSGEPPARWPCLMDSPERQQSSLGEIVSAMWLMLTGYEVGTLSKIKSYGFEPVMMPYDCYKPPLLHKDESGETHKIWSQIPAFRRQHAFMLLERKDLQNRQEIFTLSAGAGPWISPAISMEKQLMLRALLCVVASQTIPHVVSMQWPSDAIFCAWLRLVTDLRPLRSDPQGAYEALERFLNCFRVMRSDPAQEYDVSWNMGLTGGAS